MISRRVLLAGSALALGIVAASGALLTIHHAEARANSKTTSVAVYVVARNVPPGTTGDAAITNGLVRPGSIPRQFLPPTAVADVNAIRGKVASATLAAGQIVVADEFVAPQAAATSANGVTIPAGEVAVTITLDPSRAVAGLIVPGDKVDLMSIFAAPKTAAGAPSVGGTYAHFFYQNAQVLAIGSTLAPGPSAAQPAANSGSSLYTLAVSPEAAERIVLAAANGALYSALVPPNNTPVPIPAVGSSALDGPAPGTFAQPAALTPYGK